MALNLSGDFYPTYKAANPTFDADTFACAEKTVTRTLETATTSDHPGMLLGKVQSGKTRTFISVLALAFDNGFDIAVVLSKNSKALIEQTYKRLRAEFSEFIEEGELDVYDIMHCPESFNAFELESKIIFVAKKETNNINRLTKLFNEKSSSMAGKRVLIIDDEADNASIGYSKKAEVIEANKIARQISDFRGSLMQSSFLQGFRHAMVTFLVGGCIQRINGVAAGKKAKKLRYSFLVHSEAAKGSHKWQEELTEELVEKLKQAAQQEEAVFQDLVAASHADLARSLALDGLPVPPLETVIAIVKDALLGEHITIAKVNSDDDVAALLDDSGQLKLRSPLCIFIGGQVLDRGVTLANLIGFYYGRRPNKFQQDTVLQHSRMYGYRRPDLAVTRFYTSTGIRHAMGQMEEFDASLRAAIEAGGDRAVQFIRKAKDGSIVPCSPNKILVATTQAIRPHKRIIPVGFQSGYKTGKEGICHAIEALDVRVTELCGFKADEPTLIPLSEALDLLKQIEPTLRFEDEDAIPFDWEAAHSVLCHLSQQHPDPVQRGKVLLWAAKDRNSSRKSDESSHTFGGYIETPDSAKTEGAIAMQFAINHPILFLLRQNGSADKGWRDTPFYWPVVRAQANAPTAIYTAEIID